MLAVGLKEKCVFSLTERRLDEDVAKRLLQRFQGNEWPDLQLVTGLQYISAEPPIDGASHTLVRAHHVPRVAAPSEPVAVIRLKFLNLSTSDAVRRLSDGV